ncbi:hypothetical protein ACQUSR_03155 [Streptomyces sp. P1-3]|uniref:hypothetical protein n=1 Tax=Streptomyces sp. P1-3 TaxID=3421658 RepID=UPI003D362F54
MRSSSPCAGPAGTGPDPRLSAELVSVAAGARRRAARGGDRQADTAHLLHGLLESDPQVRAAFTGPQVARLLGYLVQRTIGYGLRWSGTVEDSGAVPVVRIGDRHRGPAADGDCSGWSPAAGLAMDRALRRARARGAGRAEGLDLLTALACDHASRAVEVLTRTGIDPDLLLAHLEGGPCQQSTG